MNTMKKNYEAPALNTMGTAIEETHGIPVIRAPFESNSIFYLGSSE